MALNMYCQKRSVHPGDITLEHPSGTILQDISLIHWKEWMEQEEPHIYGTFLFTGPEDVLTSVPDASFLCRVTWGDPAHTAYTIRDIHLLDRLAKEDGIYCLFEARYSTTHHLTNPS